MKLCDVRKNPYTVKELYQAVKEKLCNDENWPADIIDYDLVDSESMKIIDSSFDIIPRVMYGSSEGIYLDVYFTGSEFTYTSTERIRFCCIKTLDRSRETMRKMAVLGADIVVDLTDFLNSNSENVNWEYYSVRMIDKNGCLSWGYLTTSLEQAEQHFQKFAESGKHVVLLEKGTKKILKEHKGETDYEQLAR